MTSVEENEPTKYWYFFWWGECPVCGRDQSYRERRYTPKPENIDERYGWLPQTACCDIGYNV